MLELAAIVCLLDAPDQCKPLSLMFADEPGVTLQCQMGVGSPVQLARWRDGHPGWFVKRWRCSRPTS